MAHTQCVRRFCLPSGTTTGRKACFETCLSEHASIVRVIASPKEVDALLDCIPAVSKGAQGDNVSILLIATD